MEAASARPVTHLVFDVDGLLLDAERLYWEVLQEICGRHGRCCGWDVRAQVTGKTAVDDALGLPLSPRQLLDESQERLQSLFPTAALMPGAERLARHLRRHGVPCGLASSWTSASFAVNTRRHGDFFSLFRPVVLGDDPDGRSGKPGS